MRFKSLKERHLKRTYEAAAEKMDLFYKLMVRTEQLD